MSLFGMENKNNVEHTKVNFGLGMLVSPPNHGIHFKARDFGDGRETNGSKIRE